MKRVTRCSGTIRIFMLALSIGLVVINSVAQENIGYPRKFDEFSGSSWEDTMARLDNFALQLKNETRTIGVVIVYGGARGRRGERQAWSICVKDYLVNRRGIGADRILMMNGGYRKSLTAELWLTGGKDHLPFPEPHIRTKDVGFGKGKIGYWRSLCNI